MSFLKLKGLLVLIEPVMILFLTNAAVIGYFGVNDLAINSIGNKKKR